MATSITGLLKRKKWSGEDLGRICIANLATMFEHQMNGEPQTGIVTKAQFKSMLDTMTEPHEIRAYNNYLQVHDWICRNYNIASGMDQQALKNLFSLMNTLTASIAGEEVYRYMASLPKIMTEKQYNEYVDQRREEILEGTGWNIYQLVAEGIIHYTTKLENAPEEDNPLKGLKEKLQSEPVEDKRILSIYNGVMKRGYYELPDGTRSDKLTPEEWKRAILTEEGVEALRYTGSPDNETLDDMPEGLLTIGQSKNEKKYYEACGLEYEAEEEPRFTKKATWHTYDTPPEGLSKWDILTTDDLYSFYPALETLENIEEEARAFYNEYKEVADAILLDLEKYIAGVSKIKPEEWGNSCYLWEDIEKVDLYSFRDTFLNDLAIFAGDSRACLNGISIIKSRGWNNNIDSQGNYIPPMASSPLDNLGLAQYFPEKENYAYELDSLEICTENLLTAYYFVRGFNTALDLFSKYYSLDLEVFKINVANIEFRIDAYNGSIYSLYNMIDTTIYHEDKELKEKKLEVLRDIVRPIDYKRLTIPEDNLIKATKEIAKFTGYEDNILENLLCYIDEEILREGV